MAKRYRLTGRDACKKALIYILTGWLLLSFPYWLHGQSGVPAQPTVSWKAHFSGAISLDSLTRYMNGHSTYRLTFDAQKVKGTIIIHFSPGIYDMHRLLATIQSATGFSIILLHGDHIILQHSPPVHSSLPSHAQPRVQKVHTASAAVPERPFPTVRIPTGAVVPISGILPSDTLPAVTATRPRAVRGLAGGGILGDRGGAAGGGGRGRVAMGSGIGGASTGQARIWHLQGGVSGNEVLYPTAGAEAGFRWLHLVVSGGTDWHIQTWGIGLGSVIARNDNNEYQVKLQFFPLKEDYITDSVNSHQIMTVKGQLVRGDLLWSKRFGNRWLLKAGPCFSLLETHYYVYGASVAPGPYTSYNANPDKQFYLLKPPTVLHNSFNSNSPSNTKYWIGLSIGLYYDLSSRSR